MTIYEVIFYFLLIPAKKIFWYIGYFGNFGFWLDLAQKQKNRKNFEKKNFPKNIGIGLKWAKKSFLTGKITLKPL